MKAFPAISHSRLPWITVEQMRAVDRIAIELGIDLARMMENAGRNVALLARALLGGDATGRRVLVLAGPGGNGGGGLAAARHLIVAGATVDVRLATPREALPEVSREQHDILVRIGTPARTDSEPSDEQTDLVIDALLGYGQRGNPRGRIAALLDLARGHRVLSLDVPTGVALEDGTIGEPAVMAEATLTLALPKLALRSPDVQALAGDLFLADISIPPIVYERIGVPYTSPFGEGPIVRLSR